MKGDKQMQIYAHRGSSGTHPENTIAAFKEAASLAVHGVEFDVHMTKDGELVVIHDETIDRTSNGTGYVKDMTLAELRKYDYGSWFSTDFKEEVIPTLNEVLSIFQKTSHHINIELKTDIFPYYGIVEKVLVLINCLQLDSRVVISSFDHQAIRAVKKLAPHIETAALFMEVLIDPLEYVRTIPADALHITLPAALRQSATQAIDEHMAVRVFTVNDFKFINTLKEIGVNSVFTDFPEKMLTHLYPIK